MVKYRGIGNAICSKFDKRLFADTHARKVRIDDYFAHVDEVFETAAFIDTKGVWDKWLGKILPVTYGICGYVTGVTQQKGVKHEKPSKM